MKNLQDQTHSILDPERQHSVRVAVIDTGADMPTNVAKDDYNGRLKECRTWLNTEDSKGMPQGGDDDGHGTHLVSLVLNIAPLCDVYAAQVFPKRERESSSDSSKQAVRALHQRIANVSPLKPVVLSKV